MPSLQYWFSGAAIYFAGSFAFAIVVGLIGIKSMISKRLFAAMMVFALILTLLAWRTAARQEETSAQQDQDNRELKSTLNKIASSINIDPNQSAQSLADKIIERIQPLSDKVEKLTNPPREPLGVYKNNKKIGSATGDVQNDNIMRFSAIETTEQISPGDEFEFKNFKLRFDGSTTQSFASMSGGFRGWTYRSVTCEIIGRL
jgi:hypothetical protein